jgi:hypothetical protein
MRLVVDVLTIRSGKNGYQRQHVTHAMAHEIPNGGFDKILRSSLGQSGGDGVRASIEDEWQRNHRGERNTPSETRITFGLGLIPERFQLNASQNDKELAYGIASASTLGVSTNHPRSRDTAKRAASLAPRPPNDTTSSSNRRLRGKMNTRCNDLQTS